MSLVKWLFLVVLAPAVALAEEPKSGLQVGSEFAAKDSLACGEEGSDDARDCLAKLSWKPEPFTVRLEPAAAGCGDFLVRFPSPRPIGNSVVDLAAMEWFAARDDDHAIKKAPAIVVIHESGKSMTVGRMIARDLGAHGLHAFLLQLPGYGARRVDSADEIKKTLPSLQQAISDARRARDAVVALPVVDPTVVGIQGTSLGGFVTATTAGLDHGYNRVFILLAGGDLQEVVLHGAKDAANTRKKLTDAGVTEEQIKQLAHDVEPLRLAHRTKPAETWLYSGKFDDVVPPRCSLAFAKAAHLAGDHHIELPVDHYSGVLYLPKIINEIAQQMSSMNAPNTPAQKPLNASAKASSPTPQSPEANDKSSPELTSVPAR